MKYRQTSIIIKIYLRYKKAYFFLLYFLRLDMSKKKKL